MGSNFHTPYTTDTQYKPEFLNLPLSDLDKAISYGINPIVHCDGAVVYNALTGVLSWAGTLRILFNRADGQAIQNYVNPESITLSDNEFAYVLLNETNNTVVTVSKSAGSTGAASNFKTFNLVVLGFRNTASDRYFPVYLNAEPGVQALVSAMNVTIDWSKGRSAKITLGHDVDFTFAGAIDEDKLILRVKQPGAGSHTASFPATVRYGTDIPSIELTTVSGKIDRLGFIYDADANKYDLVSFATGF